MIWGLSFHPRSADCFRTTQSAPGGVSIWVGLGSDNRVATAAVDNGKIFFGAFALMVIGIFGAGVDLVVNPYTRAGSGCVEIKAHLFCDVALRWPGAFGVSTEPLVMSKQKAA